MAKTDNKAKSTKIQRYRAPRPREEFCVEAGPGRACYRGPSAKTMGWVMLGLVALVVLAPSPT